MMGFDHSISPLDGRYGTRLEPLRSCFSEFALMQRRCRVELLFARALEAARVFPELSAEEKIRLEECLASFTESDFRRIKDIEREVNHDVKSVEYFLRERLSLANPNRVHFGLTSEDISNLAFTLSIKDYVETLQLPSWKALLETMLALCESWQDVPFPTRTHGQFASPSTAGKELAVYLVRGLRLYQKLKAFRFTGKLNGATGNFSALQAAAPHVDWRVFAGGFVRSMDLEFNGFTTQVEDHDNWGEYFNLTRSFNNVIQDLDLDFWLYISYGYLKQAQKAGEVGSSTMPHKVNPINFENSEGNLQLSSQLLVFLSDKLCRSRMQRDLSDSTVTRNVGVALAHAHLALTETRRGLAKVQVDAPLCLAELRANPQLLAEPIQSILRTVTTDDPYNLLKTLTRGRDISTEELQQFVAGLQVSPEVRRRLLALSVEEYVGEAGAICRDACHMAREVLS